MIKMSKKINLLKIYYEKGNPLLKNVKQKENSSLLLRHLSERNQAEDDFFSWFIKYSKNTKIKESTIKREYISSPHFLEEVLRLSPELLIVYGTSIIKGEILKFSKIKY